ncbi:hypothetical protein TrCOL_g2196 [Triparma columacea]|uniref:Uncharacterized protein n=1 Tax=Triparma columacea TaxID=722753 RepID=A0A9W7G251_9STRA|nr:hypothetical protein TrCOL_g2196 [Triparma columacea]
MFWPGSSTSVWKGEDWGVWSGQRTIRVFRDRDLPEFKEGGDEGRIGEGITDEVKYVNELCSIGTNWDVVGGVDVEDVIRRVKEVYKRTPNVWGDVGRCGRGGVGCLEEFKALGAKDGEESTNEHLFEFTGPVGRRRRIRAFGKRLVFFDLLLRDGNVLQVKADDGILSDKLFNNVKMNATLLKAVLGIDGCNVRVKGYPRRATTKKPAGPDNVILVATGVKIMTPNPKREEVCKMASELNKPGVRKRRHGWYTKSGRFEVESIVCKWCGMNQVGWEEYDIHRREVHGIVRV